MRDSHRQFIGRIDKYNKTVSVVMEKMAVLSLLLVMFITFIDVLGAKVFSAPVFGSLDIVMIAQLTAICLATASTLMVGKHVQVEFLTGLMPPWIRFQTERLMNLLCAVLFVLIGWRMFVYGYGLQLDREVSPTAHIPLYPFAYGVAVASLPVALEFLLRIIRTFSPDKNRSVR